MKITRIELTTNNLLATQQFYAHRLGLPMLTATHWSVTFQVGWTELVFRQTNVPVSPSHFAINVPLYSLEQYQLWFDLPYLSLDTAGNRVAQFPGWQARAVYFHDPDGNIVEFIERQDAGFAQPGAYFQGISEIGIAMPNVAEAVTYLANTYGLTRFAKQPALPNFSAVGNDYGLFILVQTGRPWLFTDIPAAEQDCQIQFLDTLGQQRTLTTATIHDASHSEQKPVDCQAITDQKEATAGCCAACHRRLATNGWPAKVAA